jgi:hypothetical protein
MSDSLTIMPNNRSNVKNLVAIALLSASMTGQAIADEFENDFYGSSASSDISGKFYAGMDLAYATFGGSIYPSTAGLRIVGGYNITSMFAVEAGYAMLSSSSNNCDYGGCGYGGYGYGYGGYGYGYGYGYPPTLASYSFDTNSLQIAAVGSYPINDAASVSLKLGLDRNTMNYSSTDNSGNPLPSISGSRSNRMYGIGGQYDVGDGIVIRMQYEDLGELVSGIGMRMISLGGIYNF